MKYSFNEINNESCYEHITVGINIYLHGYISLLVPEYAVSLRVYLCEMKSEYIKKLHYMSELSKLIVCTTPAHLFLQREEEVRRFNLLPNFQREGGLTESQCLEGGSWEKGGGFCQGEGIAVFTRKI